VKTSSARACDWNARSGLVASDARAVSTQSGQGRGGHTWGRRAGDCTQGRRAKHGGAQVKQPGEKEKTAVALVLTHDSLVMGVRKLKSQETSYAILA
jgi:hypothetical protein